MSTDIDIAIDRETCMGSGNCMFWAPGVFDLDGAGLAHVVDPVAAPLDRVVEAERHCPTASITVTQGVAR